MGIAQHWAVKRKRNRWTLECEDDLPFPYQWGNHKYQLKSSRAIVCSLSLKFVLKLSFFICQLWNCTWKWFLIKVGCSWEEEWPPWQQQQGQLQACLNFHRIMSNLCPETALISLTSSRTLQAKCMTFCSYELIFLIRSTWSKKRDLLLWCCSCLVLNYWPDRKRVMEFLGLTENQWGFIGSQKN